MAEEAKVTEEVLMEEVAVEEVEVAEGVEEVTRFR